MKKKGGAKTGLRRDQGFCIYLGTCIWDFALTCIDLV
uniref:Uncharacterized protein n=1 Tax=Anguilla anguilla TaxID=7936 RepID=A0A0E9XPR5_ANGAN